MKETVLNRMKQEIKAYRNYLVSGKLTAKELVNEAYPFVIKQSIYNLFLQGSFNDLSADKWNWLNQQEHITDYLHGLWKNSDADLSELFSQVVHNELNQDMEVHKHE